MKKIEYNLITGDIEESVMTPEEIVAANSRIPHLPEDRRAEYEAKRALRLSAKAKLIAGQPLTEEEASALVL